MNEIEKQQRRKRARMLVVGGLIALAILRRRRMYLAAMEEDGDAQPRGHQRHAFGRGFRSGAAWRAAHCGEAVTSA